MRRLSMVIITAVLLLPALITAVAAESARAHSGIYLVIHSRKKILEE